MLSFFKRPRPSLAQQIEPRVKHANFIAAVEAAGVPPEQRPYVEPLAGDLIVAYAVDLGEELRFVSREQIEPLGLAAGELRAQALANLRRRLSAVRIEGEDPVFHPVVGANLDACLMLLDEFWENFEQELSVAPWGVMGDK